jgi:hypothetical protein
MKWVSINSQLLLNKNLNSNTLVSLPQKTFKLPQMNQPQLSVMLIGPVKELLPQLKIKVNVDHVGLFQPPVLLKD